MNTFPLTRRRLFVLSSQLIDLCCAPANVVTAAAAFSDPLNSPFDFVTVDSDVQTLVMHMGVSRVAVEVITHAVVFAQLQHVVSAMLTLLAVCMHGNVKVQQVLMQGPDLANVLQRCLREGVR